MKDVELYDNWFGNGPLFEKTTICIEDGITVLVGCNGAGKTTLMHQIRQRLQGKGIHCISYNNLFDGGNNAMENALAMEDIPFVATAAQSSEGENIIMNLGNFAARIKKEVLKVEKSNNKELWIFLDAADSGLSIDNVVQLKKLFQLVKEDCENRGISLYILVSTNAYELAREEQCLEVISGNYMTFPNYECYRNCILETAIKKEERLNGLANRSLRQADMPRRSFYCDNTQKIRRKDEYGN